MDLRARVTTLLRSPLACSFMVAAANQELGVSALARPAVSSILVAECLDGLYAQSGDLSFTETCEEAVRDAAGLDGFIATVLSDEAVSWWWGDLDRDEQLWIADNPTTRAVPDRFRLQEEPQHWYDFAQHPSWEFSIDTSTAFADPEEPELPCGLALELAHLVTSDWHPSYPLRTAHVTVNPEARVYEIHQPADWRRLALTYTPTQPNQESDQLLLESDIDDGPGPNWQRVAEDWDGVHLSLFGLLTTLERPVTADGVTTTLSNWRTERTLWLRPSFNHVRETDAITQEPRSRLHPLSRH